MSQILLHIANVVFASAHVVHSVTILLNSVSQKTVKSDTCLKFTSFILALADFSADFLSQILESRIVRTHCEMRVLHTEFR